MIVYATAVDLQTGNWVDDDLPVNVERYMRSASLVVARATNRDPYTDQPDPVTASVLNDATCAQAAAWISVGVDPGKLGLDGPAPVKSSTILGATVAYDTTAQAAAMIAAASELAPEAEAILYTAGLLWAATPQYDDSPCAGVLPTFGLDSPLPSPWLTGSSGYPGLAEWPNWPFV